MTENNFFKKSIIYNTAMFLFSFSILAVETIFMHQLLIVTNYITATFVISVAMIGIAFGSFIGFYLSRLNSFVVMLVSALLYIASIPLSYYNIIKIGYYLYPYFLILPFMFASIIVSLLFSKANSNKIYFANLVASALGVIYPIISVSAIKSENSIIVLMFIPAFFILILTFVFKNKFAKALTVIISVMLIISISYILRENMKTPDELTKIEYEQKIMPTIKNSFDKKFMEKIYKLKDGKYLMSGSKYDLMRSKYILNDIGYWKPIDLYYNIKTADESKFSYKKVWFASMKNKNWRLVFSEDDLMGKIDLFTVNDKSLFFCTNGIALDTVSKSNGTIWDPRIPPIPNPKIFIIGLSYDGIVKSAKIQPGAVVSGVEFSPIIMRIMTEKNKKGYFSKFGHYPYRGLEAHHAEGRYFLTSNTETYDMITLMNIHYEYPSIATLAPEYLHSVEATKMMLNKLTAKGMIVYEEIIETPRARYGFYKFLNTVKQSLVEIGINNPLNHVIIYSWDFWGDGHQFQTVMVKKDPFTKEELVRFGAYHKVIQPKYNSIITLHPTIKTRTTFERVFKSKKPILDMVDYPTNIKKSIFNSTILSKLDNQDDKEFISSFYRYSKKYKKYYLKNNKINENDKIRFTSLLDKADYPYKIDLRPVTDDKPFPFNVYENKKEIKSLLKIILTLASLLFIPVIFLIGLKYRAHKIKLVSHTIFFGLLGFGFMLIEIVLMQKYQRFIGSPIYSTIVILGGLLFFSGLGSLFSRNFKKRTLVICLVVIPVLIFSQAFFLEDIFMAFAKYSFVAKLFIASAMIFPLAFLMGIPFPHALEQIKQDISDEYATLMFGISGALSTVGATSSVYLSVTNGMNFTLIVGIFTYVAALGLFIMIKK